MKITITSGKRKSAVARAVTKPGSGKVRVNRILLTAFEPEIARLKLQEPLILAGDSASKLDIEVNLSGGGIMNRADAGRLAIARGLIVADKKLEKIFLDYDRHLLVADVRRKEKRKPNTHGKARAKTQKSYR